MTKTLAPVKVEYLSQKSGATDLESLLTSLVVQHSDFNLVSVACSGALQDMEFYVAVFVRRDWA
jgi:hypothetical protein